MTGRTCHLLRCFPISIAIHAAIGAAALRTSVVNPPSPARSIRVQILPERDPQKTNTVSGSPALSVPDVAQSRPQVNRRQRTTKSVSKQRVLNPTKLPSKTVPVTKQAVAAKPAFDTSAAAAPAAPALPTSDASTGASASVGRAASALPGPHGEASTNDPLDQYLRRVRAIIDAHKAYPEEARRLNLQGSAVVVFTISPSGQLDGLRLLSADDSSLASAAIRTLKQAARWIEPPPSGRPVTVEIALRFALRPERSTP